MSRKMLNNLQCVELKFITYFLVSVIITYVFTEVTSSSNNEEYPILVWNSGIVPNITRIINCYNKYNCKVSRNTSENGLSAHLFYGSHLDSNNFPLPRNNKTWALYHEESPKNYAPILYRNIQDFFNLTSTFSRKSDFPLTLQYLPNLTVLTDTKFFVTTTDKNKLLNQLAPVLFIHSDCDTPIGRDSYVTELMKYIEIDSYGECLHNKEFPSKIDKLYSLDLYNPEYLLFIAQYKFIISFENSECLDYITEKLWRPLIVGSIPIYLGSPSVKDWLPNPKSAILAQDFDSPFSLAMYIHKINNDNDLYDSFLNHKILGQITNHNLINVITNEDFGLETEESHTITEFECFICREIHENIHRNREKTSVYDCMKPKDESWFGFWKIGKCQADALHKLVAEDKPFTNESFKKLWELYHTNGLC